MLPQTLYIIFTMNVNPFPEIFDELHLAKAPLAEPFMWQIRAHFGVARWEFLLLLFMLYEATLEIVKGSLRAHRHSSGSESKKG